MKMLSRAQPIRSERIDADTKPTDRSKKSIDQIAYLGEPAEKAECSFASRGMDKKNPWRCIFTGNISLLGDKTTSQYETQSLGMGGTTGQVCAGLNRVSYAVIHFGVLCATQSIQGRSGYLV